MTATPPVVAYPVPAAVGVFLSDRLGRWLLMQRKGSHGAGTWSIPGGKMDFGETLAQCAAREVMEECGIVLDPRTVRTGPVSNDFFLESGRQFLTIFCSADLPDGAVARIAEPDKADAIGWFLPTELPGPLFGPLERFLQQPIRPPFSGIEIISRS